MGASSQRWSWVLGLCASVIACGGTTGSGPGASTGGNSAGASGGAAGSDAGGTPAAGASSGGEASGGIAGAPLGGTTGSGGTGGATSGGGGTGGTIPTGPGVVIRPVDGLSVTEAGGLAVFTVQLGSAPTADVIVALSNTVPDEVELDQTSLTFTPSDWNVARTVTLKGRDDPFADGEQAWVIITPPVTSDDPTYSGMNPPNVEGTTQDDDVAEIAVVGGSGLSTSETGTTASFSVVLRCQPTGTVTVPLKSSDDTEGTLTLSDLTFTTSNWEIPQQVTVRGVNDSVRDGAIAYRIELGPATSSDPAYNEQDPADVGLINVDDDSPAFIVSPSAVTTSESGGQDFFSVALTTQPAANVTIALGSGDPGEATVSPASVQFTPSDWQTPKLVTVTGVDDSIVDGTVELKVLTGAAVSTDSEYSGLDPLDVTVQNRDNDVASVVVTPTTGVQTTELGGTATFTVALGAQPTADVTIALSSSDPTEGTVTPATIVVTAANWRTAQVVTVRGVNDTEPDGPVAYQIVTSATTSADAAFHGLEVADVTVSNLDDEIVSPTVLVTPLNGLVTTEAGGEASFSIRLGSAPQASVGISLTTGDATEGTVVNSTVVFTASSWSTPQNVVIRGVNDGIDDGDVAYTIVTGATSSADPAYNGLAVPDVSVTNVDDDQVGIKVSQTGVLETTEIGGTATFSVVLECQPSGTVTIPVTSSDPSEGTVSITSLSFSTTTWSTPHTVTITGANDVLDDGDIPYSILLGAATSTDAAYSGLDPVDVVVVNRDNDPIVPCASPTIIDDMEDGTPAICPTAGRSGNWYTVVDTSVGGSHQMNVPFLIPGGRSDSSIGAQFVGSGYASWGASLGVNLNGTTLAGRLPYDVSGYTGIRFWARRGTSYPSSVTVQVVQQNTSKTAEGGTCGSSTLCSDHFQRTITVGTTWAEYQLPFSGFYQAGWGTVKSRDLAHVLGFEFLIKYSASYYSFDLQIDDLTFY